MGTRALVSVKKDGAYMTTCCHWDGCPSHLGRMLVEHYNTEELADKLIAQGDASAIYENLAPREGQPHSFGNPQDGVCIFYYRDRGELWQDVKPKNLSTEHSVIRNAHHGMVYAYLWKDGAWHVHDCSRNIASGFVGLASVLETDDCD